MTDFALARRIDFFAFLKKNGLKINFQNPENGLTAVMHAIKKRYLNTWPSIIISMKETNNDLQDNKGKTALIYAAEYGNSNLVKFLLLAGADITIKDNEGKTALDYAEEMNAAEIHNMLKHGVSEGE